jgi:DsbC/DsbD-like thiol-disulfide interchange protein
MEKKSETHLVPFIRAMLAALVLQLAVVPQSGAESSVTASPWVKQTYSKVRLVSGAVAGENGEDWLAGVQIRLAPGWKTYWRNPGDSGVPPAFDWSGSSNVKKAEVLYPAPIRFFDGAGSAIGYTNEVIFPVRITPENPGAPVELKVNVTFGLCETLCIPSEVTLALALPPTDTGTRGKDLALERFADLVPKPVKPGALPAIGAVEANLKGAKPELIVEAQFPEGAITTDLFAVAPDVSIPVPKPLGPAERGKQRFSIGFASEQEAAAIKGKPLTLTLVSDGGAREATIRVDGPGS